MLNAVDFEAVRFERATLCEALFAEIAPVGAHARMRACVSFQVECVVESLSAERAQVALHVRVAFHVPVQQSLQVERFGTYATRKPVGPVEKTKNK